MTVIGRDTQAAAGNPTIARVKGNFTKAANLLGLDEVTLIEKLDRTCHRGRVAITNNGKTINFIPNTAGMWLAHCPDLVKAGVPKNQVYSVARQPERSLHAPQSSDQPGKVLLRIPARGLIVEADEKRLNGKRVCVSGAAFIKRAVVANQTAIGYLEISPNCSQIRVDGTDFFTMDGPITISEVK
jgi:hypothetical protein